MAGQRRSSRGPVSPTLRTARWFVGAAVVVAVFVASESCGRGEETTEVCGEPSLRILAPAADEKADRSVREAPLVPGGQAVAIGMAITDACDGRGGGSPASPMTVRLYVEQGSQSVSVAAVRPEGSVDGFEVPFGVPDTLSPGRATLVARPSPEADAEELASVEFTLVDR